jgi:carbonic anhydrase
MDPYKKMLENNRKWAADLKANQPEYFTDLASGQSPETLFIGCSDSRVPANSIIGLPPGDVFVHRNVANLVHNADMNILSTVDFAVTHLKVQRIIVCGHTLCGGVKAAMEARDMGVLNPWLRQIRDVYRLHFDHLESIDDEESRYHRLVELNVQEQCVNILKYIAVQKAIVQNPNFSVHGWVFDVRTGLIQDLEIDFRQILKDIGKIYALSGSLIRRI